MSVRNIKLRMIRIFICGILPATVAAQITTPEPEVEVVPATARGCQRNTINVANLRALIRTTDNRLFVIAKLGKGEFSYRLNWRRLNDVKMQFGIEPDSSHIIFAEGQRVKGQGPARRTGAQLVIAMITRVV